MQYERTVNRSMEAPVDGIYRYELIPAEKPVDYYIDLWYQFSTGLDAKELLEYTDAVYLERGDCVVIENDVITVRKKEIKLKLVVNNDNN
jgi:hypothetical protein